MTRRYWLTLVLFTMPVVGYAGGAETKPQTVLFLCPYGGAKSVIAASYFNRLAQEQSLPYVAVAAAAEEPYDAVPAAVAAFLEQEGFDVRAFKPRKVSAEDVEAAARIVTIDCKSESVPAASVAIERWDDVPKVSVDLEVSTAAIRTHVEALAAELRESP